MEARQTQQVIRIIGCEAVLPGLAAESMRRTERPIMNIVTSWASGNVASPPSSSVSLKYSMTVNSVTSAASSPWLGGEERGSFLGSQKTVLVYRL